jgi:hypothetical protein
MKLDELLGLPKSGVVVLQKGNSILVSYCTSMGANLESLYNQFKGQSGIELRVFSKEADLETLKLHTEYYRKYYSKRGFSLLHSPARKAVKYRVRVSPSLDFKWMDVELVNARGDAKFVGRFKSVKEANDFKSTYYGADNPFRLPVYALNSDTKEFLSETKMLDIR